ncbi:GNAT family N-acetyltransferase [Photobacterium sp. CCB-ST2H9]|uniref:GNAT family N-acetyltransferase n=1 Tax=unclassified Photobacterium TaxID=2628852 RepID=UPI002006C080|nr:GNAT family N-acetyltransferase [Photobacterium sp. CCB-ST2H9]UTM59878.1 GNAT family N-acetyltransferase [Photobacterium sp. CCB-ST2H9]
MMDIREDHQIGLRKAGEQDMPFLLLLRELTMTRYLEKAGEPTDQASFLSRIQYQFDAAQIIEVNGQDAGLFKAFHQPEQRQWYLSQIQIHPQFQNLSIGKKLIGDLITRAFANHESVALSVLKGNPAKRLYEKLGFRCISESETEFNMVCQPERQGDHA